MANVLDLLNRRFADALRAAFDEDAAASPSVAPATDSRFGHYQCNAAMGLAKSRKMNPREAGTRILESLQIDDVCEEPEMAGPGFINLRLKPSFIAAAAREALADSRLGTPPLEREQRIVIDYPSPNLAKEMHVGHLRVAIIGDALARTLEFLGHTVLRRDHVGDYGTQFGMLIARLKDAYPEALQPDAVVDLGDINEFYREAKRRFDSDPEFKKRAQEEVYLFQSGREDSVRAREALIAHSLGHCQEIYARLGVVSELKGESFYEPFIPDMLAELDEKGLTVESEGALCVYPEGFQNKQGDPLPLIVRKSDGAYNYDTTDLTALRYRVNEEGAQRLIYVTDAGQAQHFAMVFEAAGMAGWLSGARAEHVPFGLVLGENRKKFATRSGESPRLADLLDEAESRARAIVDEKNPDLPEGKRREIARVIGVGAIKYADLSNNRVSDYVFSFDRMLALNGNTAPYLIYAYVRVQSIARKGGIDFDTLDSNRIEDFETEEEIDLGRALIRFPEILALLERDLAPHRLTDYLYDLAQQFSRFYTNNRVLDDPRQTTRLALCDLTARIMKQGLELLGIETIEEM